MSLWYASLSTPLDGRAMRRREARGGWPPYYAFFVKLLASLSSSITVRLRRRKHHQEPYTRHHDAIVQAHGVFSGVYRISNVISTPRTVVHFEGRHNSAFIRALLGTKMNK